MADADSSDEEARIEREIQQRNTIINNTEQVLDLQDQLRRRRLQRGAKAVKEEPADVALPADTRPNNSFASYPLQQSSFDASGSSQNVGRMPPPMTPGPSERSENNKGASQEVASPNDQTKSTPRRRQQGPPNPFELPAGTVPINLDSPSPDLDIEPTLPAHAGGPIALPGSNNIPLRSRVSPHVPLSDDPRYSTVLLADNGEDYVELRCPFCGRNGGRRPNGDVALYKTPKAFGSHLCKTHQGRYTGKLTESNVVRLCTYHTLTPEEVDAVRNADTDRYMVEPHFGDLKKVTKDNMPFYMSTPRKTLKMNEQAQTTMSRQMGTPLQDAESIEVCTPQKRSMPAQTLSGRKKLRAADMPTNFPTSNASKFESTRQTLVDYDDPFGTSPDAAMASLRAGLPSAPIRGEAPNRPKSCAARKSAPNLGTPCNPLD